MKINEVEALVGITKKNIRFYEEKGLLSPRRNSDNGYRDYGEAEVETLKQIKLMRKLGVPIEDIRKMLEGGQTVGDGMRRHLVTLERERQNIDEAVRLCTLLQKRQELLGELNAEQVLEEMEQLEHTGTTFQNKQKQDIRVRYVAPVAVSVLLVALMSVVTGVMVWGFYIAPQDAPPLPLVLFMISVPLLIMTGVLLALAQRIKEIGKGEVDDAKQY
ncbi:MAG: MerR family transcriptional regulator [Oscillospiraceae bacterium]|nr:MerR family transcriptional regulator [Oscillospiraceae bacterium]